jgi:hypothetical protein
VLAPKPKAPDVAATQPPPSAAAADVTAESDARRKREEQRRMAASAGGRSDTILTGGQGLGSVPGEQAQAKTLLGG